MHIKLLLLVLAGTLAAMSTAFARPACLCLHELDSADRPSRTSLLTDSV
jgi:hypothetical protein